MKRIKSLYSPKSIDESKLCYGTIIQCPDNAECNVICSESNSCFYTVVYCPSTAMCNVQCTGIYACYGTIVFWNEDLSLANFSCPNEFEYVSSRCPQTQSPMILNPPSNDNMYTFDCILRNNVLQHLLIVHLTLIAW